MFPYYILFAALALIVPFALLRVGFSPKGQVTFEGEVPVSTFGVLGKTAYAKGYDYLTAHLPDGSMLLFEETQEQIAKLSRFGIATMAHVVVSKGFFGKPEITSVTWSDEKAPRANPPSNMGAYLGVIYFMLGICALAFCSEPAQIAQIGHLGVYYAGFLLTISGWVLGKHMLKPLTDDAEIRMLGFSLGKGPTAFRLVTLLVSAITIACFYAGGLYTLLGINTAVTAGMLLTLLVKPAAKS
jgi:hypothetical protein